MNENNKVRPFGMRDKIGYMFGDYGVLYKSAWDQRSHGGNPVPISQGGGCIY